MADSETLNRIVTEPIPGAERAGESVRYDERFATIEAEIGKLENPAGGEVDWRAVEEGTIELLTGRSKDLLLVAWLTRAQYEREGLAGLATGLEMLRDFLDAWWGVVHPQRLRPRRAALEWLSEKLAGLIDADRLAGDPAATARCLAAVEAVVAWSDGRFEGEDCGLLALQSCLRSGPPPAEQAGAATSGAAATMSAVGGGGGPVVSGGPMANRAQAVARLKELAAWWAAYEPASPMVPLLQRAADWSELDFQTLFSRLLRTRGDAREYMWDVLGLGDREG